MEIANGKNPKSFLFKSVDVQKLVDTYSRKDNLVYSKKSIYPIEYVTCDNIIGKTFDKKIREIYKCKKNCNRLLKKGRTCLPSNK